MKREELKARGIADGDVDFILNAWHNGQKDLLKLGTVNRHKIDETK